MFLYRPEYYLGPVDKDGNSLEGKSELAIAKQRNGPTGSVDLFFHKAYTRFDSVTNREPAGGESGRGPEEPF
jgi:replicative DNA helicase